MNKRVLIYCRMSSNDSDKDSLSRQESVCLEHAAKAGYQIIDVLKESDKGQSGADRHAPMMNRAIQLAEQKAYDVFLCRDFTRFAREKYLGVTNVGMLNQYGVEVEFVWNKIEGNEDSQFWQIVANFFGADKERENIVKRLKEGKKDALKQGSVMFLGKPPLGYDNTKERVGNRMIYVPFIIEEDAEIVRLIFKLYTGPDKPSLREVCRELNDRGIPSPLGKKWQPGTVSRILRDTVYIGKYRYGKTKLLSIQNVLTDELDKNGNRIIKQTRDVTRREPDEHTILEVPAIIDMEVWQIAQSRLSKNKSVSKRTKFDFLLSQRIRCACGRSGVCKSKKAGSKRYMYYYCAAYHEGKHDADKCFMRIGQADVDSFVWNRLEETLTKEGVLESKLASIEQQERESIAPLEARLQYVSDKYEDAKASHDKLLDLILRSDSSELLEDKRLQLEQDIKHYDQERQALHGEIAEIEFKHHHLRNYQNNLQEELDHYGIAHLVREDFKDNLPTTFEDKLAYIERYNVEVMLIKRENGLFITITSDFGEYFSQLLHTSLCIGQYALKEEALLMAA